MAATGLRKMQKPILIVFFCLFNAKLFAQKTSKRPEVKQGDKVRKPTISPTEITTFHAENIPYEHRIILQRIFSLRADSVPGVLEMDTILNKVARRVALANLEREGIIKHADSEGKFLNERSNEEGYQGRAGEIVSVAFRACLQKNASLKAIDSNAVETGNDFKDVIRNSIEHYNGLMAKTGVNWNQFGYCMVKKEVVIKNISVCKYSLGLVLGKP